MQKSAEVTIWDEERPEGHKGAAINMDGRGTIMVTCLVGGGQIGTVSVSSLVAGGFFVDIRGGQDNWLALVYL